MSSIESLIPMLIGGTLGLLAILGIREFIKESSIALKKSSHS